MIFTTVKSAGAAADDYVVDVTPPFASKKPEEHPLQSRSQLDTLCPWSVLSMVLPLEGFEHQHGRSHATDEETDHRHQLLTAS